MAEVNPALAEPRTMSSLRLTNNNDFTIEDRFDGVPYVLEPGKSLAIPSDAARHILGWFSGVDMNAVRLHVQKRWGWNTPDLVKTKDHDKFFANLVFKPVSYKLIEVVADNDADDEELPNPIQPRGKIGREQAPA